MDTESSTPPRTLNTAENTEEYDKLTFFFNKNFGEYDKMQRTMVNFTLFVSNMVTYAQKTDT